MNITESIIQEVYKSLPYGKVASIIEQFHNDVRITDKVIEKYIDLASQKKFTFDDAIFGIRKLNKFDNIVEEKLNFVLDDESTIIITEELYFRMKEVLENNNEAIEFMAESKDNFMKMVEIIYKNYKD